MANRAPLKARVYAGTINFPMARILAPDDGLVAKEADFTAISHSVFNKITGAAVIASTVLTIGTVIFDTLGTDARWTRDVTGYNFLHLLPAVSIPDGDTTYVVQYKFTMVGGVVYETYELTTLPIL